VKNYYKIGMESEIRTMTPTRFENANTGTSMFLRGVARGKNHRELYQRGVVGIDLIAHPEEQALDVVGKVSLWEHPMESLSNLLVDIAHLLLMVGGLYLLAGAIWGGPPGRR